MHCCFHHASMFLMTSGCGSFLLHRTVIVVWEGGGMGVGEGVGKKSTFHQCSKFAAHLLILYLALALIILSLTPTLPYLSIHASRSYAHLLSGCLRSYSMQEFHHALPFSGRQCRTGVHGIHYIHCILLFHLELSFQTRC